MRKVYFLLLLTLILSGCVTKMKHNYVAPATQADFPTLNKETTVYVGDEMLIQGDIVTADFLHVTAPTGGAFFDIPVGLYIKQGIEGDKAFFSMKNTDGNIIDSNLSPTATGMYIYPSEYGTICVTAHFTASKCYDAEYKIEKRKIPVVDRVQKSLYFSGTKGNEVSFMYTEKTGVNTTHSHNVTYNTKENKVIGYRGAQIEILNVSNESITYKVLQNFTERQ